MHETAQEPAPDDPFALSNDPPGPGQRRLAIALVLLLVATALLITVGPFSGVQPGRIDAFIPAYLTAIVLSDSVTAVLLFSQFAIRRVRALLVIAGGYLFSALMILPYAVTFPGLLAPKGLAGGPQSTPWLYFIQYAGFPLCVIGYAAVKESEPRRRYWQGSAAAGIALAAGTALVAMACAALLCVLAEPLLPRLVLEGGRLGPNWPFVGVPVAGLSVVALGMLWRRRRSMLDLWLMVVCTTFALLIPLSYFSTPMRFSIGWYVVRSFAVLSSSLVLLFLMFEITSLYARVTRAVLAQRREREARMITGDTVAAAIAHEVRQPLTGMLASAAAGVRLLEGAPPDVGTALEAFRKITAAGNRADAIVASTRALFRRDVRSHAALDIIEAIEEAVALQRAELERHRILVTTPRDAGAVDVWGDRVQLQQVLLNLIANAVDALAAREEPRTLRLATERTGDGGVLVSVADNGAGIAPDDRERIFNPLYTTKASGLGMGLSICRSIVEAHRGRLWFGPNQPQGTVFRFTLRAEPSGGAAG